MSSNGWWWTSAPDEGWEGFAATRDEALKQIEESRYASSDGEPLEIMLRPGIDSEDELTQIVFTGPAETITIESC